MMCLTPTLSAFSRWRRSLTIPLGKKPRGHPQGDQDSDTSSTDPRLDCYDKTSEAASHHPQRTVDGSVDQNIPPPAYEPGSDHADQPPQSEKERTIGQELSSLRTELREVRKQLRFLQRVRRRSRQLTPEAAGEAKRSLDEPRFKMHGKLFTFDKDTREWKQRGTGDICLLRHAGTGKARLFVRRAKTLQVIADHEIVPEMQLTPGARCDRSWVWHAPAGVSEAEPGVCGVAVRFGDAADANCFKDAFIEVQQGSEDLFEMTPAVKSEGKKPVGDTDIETNAGEA